MKLKIGKFFDGTPAHRFTPSPDPRCSQVTSRGTRCKLPHGTGSDKCAIHQPKTQP